jgi:hypothetical protein
MTSKGRNRFRCSPLAIAAGYRSGLEVQIADDLEAKKVAFKYEEDTFTYTKPERISRYTPDFVLPNGIIIESKGEFKTADRQKHILIKQQHPNVDLRILFQNANSKLYKHSKTTYGAFATKHGLVWAHKRIPDEWIDEMKAAANLK